MVRTKMARPMFHNSFEKEVTITFVLDLLLIFLLLPLLTIIHSIRNEFIQMSSITNTIAEPSKEFCPILSQLKRVVNKIRKE